MNGNLTERIVDALPEELPTFDPNKSIIVNRDSVRGVVSYVLEQGDTRSVTATIRPTDDQLKVLEFVRRYMLHILANDESPKLRGFWHKKGNEQFTVNDVTFDHVDQYWVLIFKKDDPSFTYKHHKDWIVSNARAILKAGRSTAIININAI